MDYVLTIIASAASALAFSILFHGLNQSSLKLFAPIQNIIGKAKNVQLFKMITLALSILFTIYLKKTFDLSYIIFGILLGFFMSLADVVFGTGMASKSTNIKNNRL